MNNPTPEQVKEARLAAGLIQEEAAKVVYCTRTEWQRWEYGKRKMHPARWELFLEKTKSLRKIQEK